MREKTLEETKSDLVNDIITLEGMAEDLWQYHPDNDKKIDVVKSYNNIKNRINEIEKTLNNL